MNNKVAIVTGSASGIGKATVETLAQNGYRVLICDRDSDKGEQVAHSIRQNGGSAVFLEVDLMDSHTHSAIVDRAVAEWGRIDVVINNAAMVCNKAIESVTHEEWDRIFAVNLKAGFFLVQKALPYLKETRGRVVNISSTNGVKNGLNNFVYDSMKAALNHLTRGMALDLRETGIWINAIMPGGIATPLLNTWYNQYFGDSEKGERVAEEEKQKAHVGLPQQVADVVMFLCSEQASWVNGAVIPVDGGYYLG